MKIQNITADNWKLKFAPLNNIKLTLAAKVSLLAVGASIGCSGGGAPGARLPQTRRTDFGSSFNMLTTST